MGRADQFADMKLPFHVLFQRLFPLPLSSSDDTSVAMCVTQSATFRYDKIFYYPCTSWETKLNPCVYVCPVILVMGWCSILAGDIGVERQPPEEERDFFSLLVGGGVDKSPHFLTVTDSRPLEPSLFFSLSLSLSHVYE